MGNEGVRRRHQWGVHKISTAVSFAGEREQARTRYHIRSGQPAAEQFADVTRSDKIKFRINGLHGGYRQHFLNSVCKTHPALARGAVPPDGRGNDEK
jgi:hypothetical protein